MMKFLLPFIALFSTLLVSTPALADPVSIAAAIAIVVIEGATWEAIAIAAITIAAGFLSQMLAPKPKSPAQTFADTETRERTIEEQSAVSTRKLIYGEGRFSGTLIYAGSSGSDNKFLHKIVVIASHEVEAIDAVFLDEVPIYTSQLSGGTVISGKYANKVRIKIHLGSATQDADSDLINEISDLNASAKLSGCAYVYVRLESDQDLFSTIPQISAWVRGKKVTEIRDSSLPIQFTLNWALIVRDYLTTTTKQMGCGFLTTEIDDDFFQSSANISEEMVDVTHVSAEVHKVNPDDDTISFIDIDTLLVQRGDKVNVTSTDSSGVPDGLGDGYYIIPVYINKTDVVIPTIKLASSYANAVAGIAVDITSAGSGIITVTKVAEPRYAATGMIDSGRSPSDILNDMLTAGAGRLVNTGGLWQLLAGSFVTPNSLVIDEDDIVDTISVQTKHSRRDRFNAVKGNYTSPLNNSVTVGYPTVTNSTYEAQDNNIRIYADLDLPFTSRSAAAQRIAKIALERHRQQISCTIVTKLTQLGVKCGDVVKLTRGRFGWDEKEFEVLNWSFVAQQDKDNIYFNLKMDLVETASAIYDWDNGNETLVDPAPNSFLPDPFKVTIPTGLNISTEIVQTSDSAVNVYDLLITWNAHPNIYVRNNGLIEVQYVKTSDITDLLSSDFEWRASLKGTREYYVLSTNNTNTNLLLQSDDLTDSVWTTVGTPVITLESDGWTTVEDDDDTVSEYIYQNINLSGSVVTMSLEIKKDTDVGIYPRFGFILYNQSGSPTFQRVLYLMLNPATGDIGLAADFPVPIDTRYGLIDLGDRWRLWATLNNTKSADTAQLMILPAQFGTIADGVASDFSETYTHSIKVRNPDIKISSALTPTATTTTIPVAASGDPGLAEPFELDINSVIALQGHVGELTSGTWDYGDNDGLGFDTIYVRMDDDSNPMDSANTLTYGQFKPSFFVDGRQTKVVVNNVEFGVNYNVRIRALNYLKFKSDWVSIYNYQVGTSGGVVSRLDYGLTAQTATTALDYALVTDSVGTTADYGMVG